MTTRETPARRTASVQGGVRPWWLQGSIVTYMLAPRALSPACFNAATSAWSAPALACQPSPITEPSRARTAPTIGLGVTV